MYTKHTFQSPEGRACFFDDSFSDPLPCLLCKLINDTWYGKKEIPGVSTGFWECCLAFVSCIVIEESRTGSILSPHIEEEFFFLFFRLIFFSRLRWSATNLSSCSLFGRFLYTQVPNTCRYITRESSLVAKPSEAQLASSVVQSAVALSRAPLSSRCRLDEKVASVCRLTIEKKTRSQHL